MPSALSASTALILAALTACSSCAKPHFGETLIVVDTDVSVPTFVSRLQVDLYSPDATWYQSRAFSALRREDWPLSFSLYTDEKGAGKPVRLRLRAFPEGGVRDYRGEQAPEAPPFIPASVAHSLEELCADPPLLPPLVELTQRRGAEQITEHLVGSCPFATRSGSVAARVEITQAGTYRFEVVRATPDGANSSPPGSTTLFLRRACADASSELGCNQAIDQADGNFLSRLELTLDPGTYYLVTGSAAKHSPADVTLRWARTTEWFTAPPAPDLGPPAPVLPRLVVDGIDVTPASEPQPNLAIDRLLTLSVDYGALRTVSVLLTGECYGTGADLTADTTCVDVAGVRVPVATAAVQPQSGIDRGGAPRSGTWAGEAELPCTVPAKATTPGLYDDQVCIPGGAFLLGSEELTGVGLLTAVPRQLAVVAPFFLDRYEVTVARYRQALRDGFVPPDLGVTPNEGPLEAATGNRGCTFNGDASGPTEDRESYPLNCVSWRAARALCQFWGGDLPSHAQWEYAATVAGRPDHKSRYAWGDDPPDCSRAVYGNGRVGGPCGAQGVAPVDAAPWVTSDVTPLGVVGLAGNVSEWVIDSFRPYADPCWWQRPLRGVGCQEDEAPLRSIRGDNWFSPADGLLLAAPLGEAPEYALATYGFRCARPGVAP
jgi:formylglycine-generating enzyme required for sulfatase activity